MAIRVSLHHKTSYVYERPIVISPQIVRLRPAAHTRTPILSYSLKVGPEKHFLNWQQDPFGNYLARLVFPEKTNHLDFTVDLTAEIRSFNPFDFFLEPAAEEFPFLYEPAVRAQLLPYLNVTDTGPGFEDYAKSFVKPKMRTIDFLVSINQKVHRDISYLIRMEPGVQTSEETLVKRSGSCRDTAHLLVQTLRTMGLATRFVSGYLIQLTQDEKPLTGPPGPERDFTDLHAWAEVFLPGAGWIGLDPTSGLFAGEGHIPLACTPLPSDAAPIEGAIEPCKSTFDFQMDLRRISESARVTKPYTEEQWKAIVRLGEQTDREAAELDMRLTSGGEPTFVSDSNRDAPEWNTAANGVEKKELARRLSHSLMNRMAPGASFHSGQGKWYPGEELPRWAYAIFFRTDGLPVWSDPRLFADETVDYGHGLEEAKTFVTELSHRLVKSEDTILPGYEDGIYYLWKESNLPSSERTWGLSKESDDVKLKELLGRGLEQPSGFALPLRFDPVKQEWETVRWTFRGGKMFLIPGDSPMGYRLPLDRLSGPDFGPAEISPLAEKPPFPDLRTEYTSLKIIPSIPPAEHPRRTGMETMRTALCVESRKGRLHVFLPPFSDSLHYLLLMREIHDTARRLNFPVMIEGYEPPVDPRLKKIAVTPDPGVIEVNIDPSYSWKESAEKMEILYEEAKRAGLTSEKFMHDGRRTGTGGGNHITLGGRFPVESPFLRRPDLLRSFISYFQNHPSLSYFFSGMFIGPTSQAPRLDESNPDALYELEIAFAQLPEDAVPDANGNYNSWLLDRLLRNLLTDQTGNTHRTEICIDKLHSQDSLSGRLGLVEFRSFEMPYHHRMNSLQHLLMRTMAVMFWKKPYTSPLIDWGFMLKDKYRLPVFLYEDLVSIVRDLNDNGFPFSLDWFNPFLENRFPLYGLCQIDETQIELRMALEAWNVLGEEMFMSGTARAVDAAVERLQVKLTHFNPERYTLLCNGRPVPLQPTGATGVFAAGVRFKAWSPPRTLHPSLPHVSTLYFDLYDRTTGCSLGGCTYHVSHPGGRSYDAAPVNEKEAESRMISRFSPGGHYPHSARYGEEKANSRFPCTLDLRYAT